MKSYYDVVGSGEGISGLIACALLAQKGFSCLWADTSRHAQPDGPPCGVPLLLTRDFWSHGVRPLLAAMDPAMPGLLRPRMIGRIQAVIPGRRFDVGPELADGDLSIQVQQRGAVRYLNLLGKSMTRPGALLRASSRPMPAVEFWQRDQVTALGRTGKPGYLAYLRWMTSLTGMCSIDYVEAKKVLGEYLLHNRGGYLCTSHAEVAMENGGSPGLSMHSTRVRARHGISESFPGGKGGGGFVYYATCVVDEQVIPVGMGDMLVVSPPEDMRYPLVVVKEPGEGCAVLSVITKVPVGTMLASRTELLSWASGMVMKRLRQVIPYLEEHLVSFEALDPFDGELTRPWFRYADEVRAPWFVSGKRFMMQGNRIFACNGMQYGCLDTEGEVLWGICMANAILDDLNRSDLITGRISQITRA